MDMSNAERFYVQRDRRTVEYDTRFAEEDALTRLAEAPVGIAIGPALAETRVGQVALLALANQAARFHRRLRLWVPQAPLAARTLVPARDLADAVLATVAAIDPFAVVEMEADARRMDLAGVALGIPNAHAPINVGWDQMLATIASEPQPTDPSDGSLMGAALASCLGAAGLMQLVLGRPIRAARVSLDEFRSGAEAEPGIVPVGPLQLGTVLVVGAGAVCSALLYWLRELGVIGRWIVTDKDVLELHNSNRTIGAVVSQTDWGGATPIGKAEAAAALIGAEAAPLWYHDYRRANPEVRPDVILPLANEHGARRLVGIESSIAVHATTSRDWTAELHRHVAGVDECVSCRFPEPDRPAAYACSTAPVPVVGGTSTDAALPFLSAAAGLLLVRGLQLHAARELAALDTNFVRLWLGAGRHQVGDLSRLFAPAAAGCTHMSAHSLAGLAKP